MVLNLAKSSKAYTKQISKDDSSKSALSRLSPGQSVLFNLLTVDDFETYGTPDLNDFTSKLTKGRDPMRATNMVRQSTSLWGAPSVTKASFNSFAWDALCPTLTKS
jgi:hypothetical protein